VKTAVIFFPFDLFGSSGAGDGVRLLADELREILADNRREHVPTRAGAYAGKVRLHEFSFEKIEDYQDWRARGRRAIRQALDRGDFLLWIAGNHLGVLPLYDELANESADTLVVQLDAHLDIHHFSSCSAELTHGNFLRHCAGRLPPLINVGHRELLLRPEDIHEFYTATFGADALTIDAGAVHGELRRAGKRAKRVFLDIDCDVFDAAHFPAVAQAVPFGLTSTQLLTIVDAVWSSHIAGVAISEFHPAHDRDDRSLAALVWLLEYLILRRYE
jgi:arginase family enzyme